MISKKIENLNQERNTNSHHHIMIY